MAGPDLEEEQALSARARSGDRDAAGVLLRRYGPRLYRSVLLPRLGNVTLAEDALAASYLEALKSLRGFEWQGVGFYPWFRKVGLRVAYRALERTQGETLCDPVDVARELERVRETVAGPDEELEHGQAREFVERALEGLGPQQAEALRLRVLEERSRDELAARWGIDVNAVDQRVHRAKTALREALHVSAARTRSSPLLVLLVDGGRGPTVHVWNRAEVLIGRTPDADLVLPGDGVSRRHAAVRWTRKGSTITDLGSSNGTLLGGRPLGDETPLEPGQPVRIGGYTLALVRSPLLSMWARAVLAETAAKSDDAENADADVPPLPSTAPLSQVLRRHDQEEAVAGRGGTNEERIEELLRAAWGIGTVDAQFQERALAAVLVTSE